MKKILQHTLYTFCLCFSFLLLFASVSCQPLNNFEKDPTAQGKTVPEVETPNGYSSEIQGRINGEDSTGAEEIIQEENAGTQEEQAAISPELLQLKPNELGEALILMYHEIGYPEAEWKRTPENFRRDLETLYEQGYRAVPLRDLVSGNIDLPAGTSPVVFTFDDGNKGNFYYAENGGMLEPAADCAVEIMEKFYKENPDFGLAATFFIYYPNPFRETQHVEKKLNYLVSRGLEIGNHTYGHANLAGLSPDEIQRELALHCQKTREYVAGYTVSSLALPYGSYPKENSALLLAGSFEETTYKNEAVLLVGANPCVSPFHKKFDASRLPRIRASEIKTEGVGLYDWLEYFQQHPHKRYISDGDPRFVTAPDSCSDFLNEFRTGEKKARFYAN